MNNQLLYKENKLGICKLGNHAPTRIIASLRVRILNLSGSVRSVHCPFPFMIRPSFPCNRP